MQKQLLLLLTMASLLPLLLVGCSGVGFYREELALLESAKRAYRCESCLPGVTKYSRHFERGWKQAYYNVAKGQGTYPPSTPPEAYWSQKYQNADGCRKIAAWYEGFRLGSEAAQRDCRHLFSDVPIVAQCERETACFCCPEDAIRSKHVPASESYPTETHPTNDSVVPTESVLNASIAPDSDMNQVQFSSFETTSMRRLSDIDE